jgi:hypothetical protein
MIYTQIYLYATERDDGFQYAIGGQTGGSVNGSVALFEQRGDALLFGNAYQERHGVPFVVLPSAERRTGDIDARRVDG